VVASLSPPLSAVVPVAEVVSAVVPDSEVDSEAALGEDPCVWSAVPVELVDRSAVSACDGACDCPRRSRCQLGRWWLPCGRLDAGRRRSGSGGSTTSDRSVRRARRRLIRHQPPPATPPMARRYSSVGYSNGAVGVLTRATPGSQPYSRFHSTGGTVGPTRGLFARRSTTMLQDSCAIMAPAPGRRRSQPVRARSRPLALEASCR
jgi:hypothetical protein